MNIEQIAYEEASGEMLDSFNKEQLAAFLRRCLSKLAEQTGVVPVAWESIAEGLTYENHYSDNKPLYSEAQYIAAQQRTAEACAKVADSLRSSYGNQASGAYVGTYDFKQIAAEEIIDEICNGEWREYL